MTLLLEDPTPALMVGAVLITMAAIVYTSLRTRASLYALLAAVALCATGVTIELLVVTPREFVENAMDSLLADVEANDLDAVVARMASSATSVKADAQRLMPEFDIDKANRMGAMTVTLDNPSSPSRADVECRVFISAQHRRTGAKGGDMADVTFHFVRSGDAWLLEDYSGSDEWRKGAAHLRSKR